VKILIVSGIWPPDVGGPASHAPEVARFLAGRGHEVRAVVAADRPPAPQPFPVDWISRRLPKGVVHAVAGARIAQHARRVDVVYSTGMFGRTGLACRAVRAPYVLKLTGDPAFERARWLGRVDGDVDAFQAGSGGLATTLLRRLRDVTVHGAAHVVCPSAYLAELAVTWGAEPSRVSVLPNPAPAVPALGDRDALRASFGMDGLTFAFAGRLGPQKALHVALAAVDRVEDVTFLVAGDGDLRELLEADAGPRARFIGPLPRDRVLELFAAADAALLSSSWENFPHSVVEALAVGTPVIATAVGGVAEVVDDGVNGLLVPPDDVDAFTRALERFASDEPLRARLHAAAAPSVERFSSAAIYGELERVLDAARR
jgi:glycosyltransferase involved in cell wall biosynthesis